MLGGGGVCCAFLRGGVKRSTNVIGGGINNLNKKMELGGGVLACTIWSGGGGILSQNIWGKGCALSIKVGGGGKGQDIFVGGGLSF